jgi:hypothetical protein
MFSAGGFGANEELRFGIGAAVECYRGSDLGWARGEVIAHDHIEEEEGDAMSYQIRLCSEVDDEGDNVLIFAPSDDDGVIRAPEGHSVPTKPSAVDAESARARWQNYIEHSVPSLETAMREVTNNRYLTAILNLQQMHAANGFAGGVDIIDDSVAWPHESLFEGLKQFNPACHAFERDLAKMRYREKLAVVPVLRRLGFCVTLFRAEDGTLWSNAAARQTCPFLRARHDSCPFQLSPRTFRLHHRIKNPGRNPLRMIELPPTDPRSLRNRGLLRCAPKLLILGRRAMERCSAPGGRGAAVAEHSFKRMCTAGTFGDSAAGGGAAAATAE